MTANGQSGLGWTVVLRRMPTKIVAGQPVGGYTDAFEIVCCDCGDDPDLDYRDVSPELQRIRGPYQPIADGVAAYEEHVESHGPCAQLQTSGREDRVAYAVMAPDSPAEG
jgi:hypothetical protein